MYAPDAFVAPDPVSIVRTYPFAVLTTYAAGQIFATSTPLFFESEGNLETMVGHLARVNPHALALQALQPALAIFSGPSAYISASWYRARPSVPTWNYVAAQVRGVIEPVDDEEQQLTILRHSAAIAEADAQVPWTLEQAPEGRVAALLPRIRAFRIRIEHIAGVTKLSQIQPPADFPLIIRQLLQKKDPDSTEIARLMSRLID
jgi:transcriptional regulator